MPGGREPVQAAVAASEQAIEWPLLTKEEVEKAVFRNNPDKTPGPDEISFRVWRELWPVVSDHMLWLYNTSLELYHIPQRWKTARIVTLRKPGKADYTIPKAFRPLSLLPTISKGLEAESRQGCPTSPRHTASSQLTTLERGHVDQQSRR
jgi:hypothetical protein